MASLVQIISSNNMEENPNWNSWRNLKYLGKGELIFVSTYANSPFIATYGGQYSLIHGEDVTIEHWKGKGEKAHVLLLAEDAAFIEPRWWEWTEKASFYMNMLTGDPKRLEKKIKRNCSLPLELSVDCSQWKEYCSTEVPPRTIVVGGDPHFNLLGAGDEDFRKAIDDYLCHECRFAREYAANEKKRKDGEQSSPRPFSDALGKLLKKFSSA